MMTPEPKASAGSAEGLRNLQRFCGEPAGFWRLFAHVAAEWCEASGLAVLTRSGGLWRVLASHPVGRKWLGELAPEKLDAWAALTDPAQEPKDGHDGAWEFIVVPLRSVADSTVALISRPALTRRLTRWKSSP